MNTKYVTAGKQIRWHMGHRVWTQDLGHYTKNKCTKLHGHEYLLDVRLSVVDEQIKDTGMVIDFSVIGRLKFWIDTYLDHRLMLDINDPMLEYLLSPLYPVFERQLSVELLIYYIPHTIALSLTEKHNILNQCLARSVIQNKRDLQMILKQIRSFMQSNPTSSYIILFNLIPKQEDKEVALWYPIVNSFVLVNFVPTAENIGWMFKANLSSILYGTHFSLLPLENEFKQLCQTLKLNDCTVDHRAERVIQDLESFQKTLTKPIRVEQITIWETYSAYAVI